VKSAVPFPIEIPDRIPKQRYYDQAFFDLEAAQLWSRTWQMACRLEEIPEAGDFATYEILDQSVIVVRGADGPDGEATATAMQNTCRHRGVRLVEPGQRGSCSTSGFTCPFHGWCYGPDGTNTFVPQSRTFSDHNLATSERAELDLTPVRCETWGGMAWINLDPTAPPLRECIEPFASVMDAWRLGSMRAEWWYAARIPANWKACEEAFVEQYHVLEAHPQLRLPARYPAKDGTLDPAAFKKGELSYLRLMSRGMAGMVHASDVRLAEQLARSIKLPAKGTPDEIRRTWDTKLNDKVTAWHRKQGHDMPDINELEAAGLNQPMGYCFPHFFVLPMYSSASSYRFRPLGPEETLMEIWSLTRFAPGEEPEAPPVPEWWAPDDPRWPPIPRQDFGNLPRQQLGLHAQGFEFMRLSELAEGHISNLHRTIDGFLAGLPHKKLRKALEALNVNPLEQPIVDVGL
jgi:phenylpropionate dioxygenase-like ring-hydroxylating dioxygenase large terminal subunit